MISLEVLFAQGANRMDSLPGLWKGATNNSDARCECTWTVLWTTREYQRAGWNEFDSERARTLIYNAIRDLHPDFTAITAYPIFEWNDKPERTKEESAAVLRHAAELAHG